MTCHKVALSIIVLLAAGSVGRVQAQEEEPQAVLAVVEDLLQGLNQRDGDAVAETMLPEGELIRVSGSEVTRRSFQEFCQSLGRGQGSFLERIFEPTILIREGIAQVWAEYNFHLDGEFSHCGVNSFSLVRTARGWKVSGVVYNVEREGCNIRPLDPE